MAVMTGVGSEASRKRRRAAQANAVSTQAASVEEHLAALRARWQVCCAAVPVRRGCSFHALLVHLCHMLSSSAWCAVERAWAVLQWPDPWRDAVCRVQTKPSGCVCVCPQVRNLCGCTVGQRWRPSASS